MNLSILMPLALVPMMMGTAPRSGTGEALVAQLCNGGTITIPLGDDEQNDREFCPKNACHSSTCRRRV